MGAIAILIIAWIVIAFGWGGRDFVDDNIYRWAGQTREEVAEATDETATSEADTDATDMRPTE